MSISSEHGIPSRVLKVKLFSNTSVDGLEKDVNTWLGSNNVAVRDIIYQHQMCQGEPRATFTGVQDDYSCMVIYTG